MNALLIIVGWTLCLPAILFGPLAKRLPIDVSRPWVDGLLVNTLRAWKKYDTKSWIRRMIGIAKNPRITLHYLALLSNRVEVARPARIRLRVSDLVNTHDVQTDHLHHRMRVEALRAGRGVNSDYGDMIVVGNAVHDGNHRLAAYREAGVEYVEAVKYPVIG